MYLLHFYSVINTSKQKPGMLVAENLIKKYSDLTVVNGVSLNIKKGEFVSVIGASGAGKSTLLHLLGALDKPDKGKVMIDNTDVFSLSGKKQAQFRNKNIGFVFQFHHLLPEFSALENVSVPVWISGKNKNDGMKLAAEMLQRVGLGNKLENKPSELSGGEQQRVAIARALVNGPSIIMADEPTGNLDSTNAVSVHRLFKDLCREMNQTFIIITHNEELAKMTDRTLVMKDGNIVEEIKNV